MIDLGLHGQGSLELSDSSRGTADSPEMSTWPGVLGPSTECEAQALLGCRAGGGPGEVAAMLVRGDLKG